MGWDEKKHIDMHTQKSHVLPINGHITAFSSLVHLCLIIIVIVVVVVVRILTQIE